MTAPGAVLPDPDAAAPSARQAAEEQRSGAPNWMRQGRGVGEPRLHNEGYSVLVRRLKVGLPLAALAMVGLVAAWPYLTTSQDAGSKIDKNQTTMLNARYYARDKQDRPFSVTAKSAALVPGASNLVDMVQPEGEMTQSNGSWLTMNSDRGRYNQDDGRLLMLDNVHLLRDDGFEFVTDEAEIDTKTGNAWGHHPVVGHGPSGVINADGFVATDRGKTISFVHSSTARVLSGPPSQQSPSGTAPATGNGPSP